MIVFVMSMWAVNIVPSTQYGPTDKYTFFKSRYPY